ncbi:MAG: lactate utilization protein [Desulfobacteraceae bacterium]|nr:lactate utilization protein [Desulfobacteraceae bacterium]
MDSTVDENTQEFIEKATLVSARVYRVKDMASALDKALDLCKSKQISHAGIKTDPVSTKTALVMAAPNLDEDSFTSFFKDCRKNGNILLIRDNLRKYPDGIDMGLTLVDFGIAETGTLVLNSDSEETRLATMLCETNVAILRVTKIRKTALLMADELNELIKNNSSYTAFITGASRTGDIERVLALGVHGPLELIILLVEA